MDGIADYEFVRSCGSGGHGEVYLARPPARLSTPVERVAVKVLAGVWPVATFRRASQRLRACAATRSPYLVTIFDVGQHDGRCYYAMQHLPDGSLARPARPLAEATVLRSIADVARAAAALHAAGLTHRAITAANTLLTSYGAKLSEVDVTQVLSPGVIVTATQPPSALEFTDPRLWTGEPARPHHDVWSIGVLLHRAVAGTSIYGEPPAGDALTALRWIHDTKPAISSALPGPVAEIVGDCLAPPSQRPTAGVVADLLAAVC